MKNDTLVYWNGRMEAAPDEFPTVKLAVAAIKARFLKKYGIKDVLAKSQPNYQKNLPEIKITDPFNQIAEVKTALQRDGCVLFENNEYRRHMLCTLAWDEDFRSEMCAGMTDITKQLGGKPDKSINQMFSREAQRQTRDMMNQVASIMNLGLPDSEKINFEED